MCGLSQLARRLLPSNSKDNFPHAQRANIKSPVGIGGKCLASCRTCFHSRHDTKSSLWVAYQPNNPESVDIIFIYDLGKSISSWKKGNKLWPLDIIRTYMPSARIMFYSYGDPNFNYGNVSIISTVTGEALSLLKLLRNKRAERNVYNPLIFVCHSFGGLVVKKALGIAYKDEDYDEIARHTIGVAFVGVPHHGSNYATWASTIANLPTPGLNEELRLQSQKLGEADTKFFDYVRNNPNLNIASFFEPQPSRIDSRTQMIASESSAATENSINISVGLGHFSWTQTKFEELAIRLYDWVCRPGAMSTREIIDTNNSPSVDQLLWQGWSYRDLEDHQRQIQERAKLRFGSSHPRAVLESKILGDVYFCCGLWQQAHDVLSLAFEEATRGEPDKISHELRASIRASLCLTLIELGELEHAKKLNLENCVSESSVDVMVASFDNLAAIHFRQTDSASLERSLMERRKAWSHAKATYGDQDCLTRLELMGLKLTSKTNPGLVKDLNIVREIWGSNGDFESGRFEGNFWAFNLGFTSRHLANRQASIEAFISMLNFTRSGDRAELERATKRAEEPAYSMRRDLGPDHPDSLQALHNLALSYALAGHLRQAEELSSRVVQGASRTIPQEHPLAKVYSGLYAYLLERASENQEGVEEAPNIVYLASMLVNWAQSPMWIWGTILKGVDRKLLLR